jgi:excisionase family DNA binding protein
MNKEKSHPENDRLLLISEMAVEMRSSRKTVRRRIESGKLTAAFKEGGRWLIWRSKLLAYLGAGGDRA